MRLLDFICTDAVLPDMKATTAREAIEEMFDALVEAGAVSRRDRSQFVQAVLRRERKGTTGFGGAVAVPHAKHEKAKGVVGTVGRSAAGIDFKALDGQPVQVFFLVVSNPDCPQDHLKAMEHIFRSIKNENLRRFLCRATTREALVDLLREADEELD